MAEEKKEDLKEKKTPEEKPKEENAGKASEEKNSKVKPKEPVEETSDKKEEKKEDDSEEDKSKGKKRRGRKKREEVDLGSWKPKTNLGRLVKDKKIDDIDEVLENYKILEPEIVDSLIKVESNLLAIGQSKGKYGGGKRRVFRQTQKKTAEGNKLTFSSMAVVGNKEGYLGMGIGKAQETFPSRDKALKKARLNITKIKRGCGSFHCSCNEPHSVPLEIEGKCGSSRVVLIPAPQGTGLVIGDECKKILEMAGIKDVYSKTFGQTRQTINLAKACLNALEKTMKVEQ